jgi:hypothetical protein
LKRTSKEPASTPKAARNAMRTTIKASDARCESRSAIHELNCTETSRQRRLVQRDVPLRTPRRGSGKSEPISEEIHLISNSLRQPPPAAPAKNGFGV